MSNTNKITVYCYGKKHTFSNRTKASAWCLKGIAASEGSESERYSQILADLTMGKTVVADCDGIPAKKPSKTPLTAEEIADWERTKAEKTVAGDRLDEIRARIQEKRDEFERSIADLLAEEEKAREAWGELALKCLAYQKRAAK